jgi:stage II sporulation protein R
MLKKWELSVLIGLCFTIILSTVSFTYECKGIEQNVLRLHILANSDSKADQALKLKVRDRLLLVGSDLFSGSDGVAEAQKKAIKKLSLLQTEAEKVIKDEGFDYPVKIEIAKSDFETRVYDNITLPAGRYNAVRVLIGNAEGQNWWCVMFPPMCIPAAQPQKELSDVLTAPQNDIVENGEKYEIRFKVVEWFEQLRKK